MSRSKRSNKAKKKVRCEHCSELANKIADAVLMKFRLRFAADEQNYWGISSMIPKIVTEIIDQVLEEESERTAKESERSQSGTE